ncbi:UNVERIFIED_CONTAM: hypothetical protein Sradi_3655300 [Sesamum radiatum]|uniref:AT-hook motif nuclear-localized protein n=1 Tax=Sesamum radiatum TaxID=300843 RepID=A0AAW2QJS7_SESRA
MNSSITNKVRAKKGTILENVLLELVNAEAGGFSTLRDNTSSTVIVHASVALAVRGPSGENTPAVHINAPANPPSPRVGGSSVAPGEPSKSNKRKKEEEKQKPE